MHANPCMQRSKQRSIVKIKIFLLKCWCILHLFMYRCLFLFLKSVFLYTITLASFENPDKSLYL